MAEYSEQNLKYAAELRNEIHREALAIVRRTLPDAEDVVDRHPVEDYFQEVWDYPGKWYPVVAIPYGYKNRKAFVDSIVENTLAGLEPDPFYLMIGEYPDLAVDYFIVKNGKGCTGYEAHMRALKTAFGRISDEWEGDPDKAVGTLVDASRLFHPTAKKESLITGMLFSIRLTGTAIMAETLNGSTKLFSQAGRTGLRYTNGVRTGPNISTTVTNGGGLFV